MRLTLAGANTVTADREEWEESSCGLVTASLYSILFQAIAEGSCIEPEQGVHHIAGEIVENLRVLA